jgi:hypothetical protein
MAGKTQLGRMCITLPRTIAMSRHATLNSAPASTPTNIDTPVIAGLSGVSSSQSRTPQGSQPRAFKFIAVKQIVGIERNQSSVRMRDMDAAFFHRTDVE